MHAGRVNFGKLWDIFHSNPVRLKWHGDGGKRLPVYTPSTTSKRVGWYSSVSEGVA